MSIKLNCKRYSWIVFILFSFNFLLAKENPNKDWKVKDPFYDRSFIENKGQFIPYGGNIAAGVQNEDFSMYFKPTGFLIAQTFYENEEAEREREEQMRSGKSTKEDKVEMHKEEIWFKAEFLNASYSSSISFENKLTSTYGFANPSIQNKTINNIPSYEKLIYNNLYPGINAKFTFDKEKYGVKYCYYVSPGSDPSQIKIKYEAVNLSLDTKGNLHIKQKEFEMIDLAPVAFCDGKTIKANYKIEGNVVSIELESYNHSKELIIDPFAINPAFTAQNKAFDVACDAAGNVYAFGGSSPWKLKKFNNAGVLQWTYNTTYASWYGDLAVDLAGNSYITEGCCGGGIQKISTGNTITWNQNYGTQEFWCLAFNCDYSTLYMAQGYASVPFIAQSMSILNQGTGVVTGLTAVAASEPRALAWGPSNNMYLLTCGNGGGPNRVIGVTPAFAPIFNVANGYALLYNGPSYANGSNPTSGQNGIAAGQNFICTTNGLTVFKRDLATGAVLATINVPGGVVEGNSGILIDACDYIYVGSSTGIYKYDSNLNFVSTSATAGAVYCLFPARIGGEVLACGNGFLGSYSMNYNLKNFTLTVNTQPAGCTCAGTASAVVNFSCNPSAMTYSWSTGATTPSIGGLCPGNYWVKVSSSCLNKDSLAFTILGSVGNLTVNSTVTNASCSSPTGTVTINSVTNGLPTYTITENVTTIASNVNVPYSITNVSVGTHTYVLLSANGCTVSFVVNVLNGSVAPTLTVTTPVMLSCSTNTAVLNAASTSTGALTYTWTGPGIVAGSATTNPTVNLVGNYTVALSNGACTTTAVVSVINNTSTPNVSITLPSTLTCIVPSAVLTGTSTTAGVNYQWTAGPASNTMNTSTAGNYTLTVTDPLNGCTNSAIVAVSQNSIAPNITIATPATLTCINSTINIIGNSTTGGVTYQWSGGPATAIYNVSTPGIYTLTVTDPINGCTSTSITTVNQNIAIPNVSILNPAVITCANNFVILTGTSTTSGVNYQWTGGPATANFTVSLGGTYSLTVTNPTNGCTNTATVLVNQNNAIPTLSISPAVTLSCINPTTVLSGTSTTAGVNYQWTAGPATNTMNTSTPGNYTLTVTDPSNSCTNSAIVTVSQNSSAPNISIATPATLTCINSSINITGNSTTGGVTYQWSGGPATAIYNVNTPGTYTLTVTDPSNSCTSVSVTSVNQNIAIPDASVANPAVISCTNANVTIAGNSTTSGVTYQWNGGPASANFNVSSAGSYTLTVTNSANGCTNTATVSVSQNISIPTLSISPAVTLTCFVPSTILSGTSTSVVNYQWTNGPASNTYPVNAPGTYTLTVTDPSNGCKNSLVTTVTQFSTQPTGQIISPGNNGCAPLCITFSLQTNPTAASSVWYFGDGSSASGSVTANHCFNTTGIYTITNSFIDIYGCAGNAVPTTVEVYPKPVADFNFAPLKPIINIDPEVVFTDASHSANIITWNWYFMNTAQYTSVLQNPAFAYTEPGSYAVALVVKSDHGCLDTLVREIIVGEDYGIYIPNVFTPNADGINDVFQPKGFGITKYELRIFDRWGEELMFTNDFNQGWDGKYKNKLSKEDVYVWTIRLTNVFGKAHELTGHVTLIK